MDDILFPLNVRERFSRRTKQAVHHDLEASSVATNTHPDQDAIEASRHRNR